MTVVQLLPVTVFLFTLLIIAAISWLGERRSHHDCYRQLELARDRTLQMEAAIAEARSELGNERHEHSQDLVRAEAALAAEREKHRSEMDGMVAGLHQACDSTIKAEGETAVMKEQLARVTSDWTDLLRRYDRPLETDPAAIEKPAGCPICQSSDLAIMHALWRVSQDPAVDPVRSGHRLGCVNCLTEWSLGHNAVTFNLRPGPGVVDTTAKEKANLGAVGLSAEEKVAGMSQRRTPRTDLRFRKPPGKRAAPIEEDEDDA